MGKRLTRPHENSLAEWDRRSFFCRLSSSGYAGIFERGTGGFSVTDIVVSRLMRRSLTRWAMAGMGR
ncbi:hypothetical protein SBA3_1390037 [Candidatus Sulfopaludibacter sp. SbA3]|nr:hypothetical protein SBA3_1390037 [Candidatus Sulfopaludibacter sp. SbA3]